MTSDQILLILLGAGAVYHVWEKTRYEKTIQSLHDRLMSRSVYEFKRSQSPKKKEVPSPKGMTDEEMAKWEMIQKEGQDAINDEIENKLDALREANLADRVGIK